MTPQEALQIFGQSINAQYYDGSDYTDCVFQYDSVQSVSSIDSEASYQFGVGSQFLRYYCFLSPGTVVQNPTYITFDITPTYSILNTSQIHSFIALSSRLSISDTYQSPSWDWSVGGSNVHLENDDRISSGSSTRARLFADGVVNAVFVPFDFSSASLTSGYSYRATFSGNYGMGDSSNRYALCIGLPYISTDATGAVGTLPPESSGGDTNITVNVDMSETNEKLDESNGFLSSIVSWITDFFSNLGSFFIRLFVPAEGFIDNWKEDLAEAIADTFSPVDTVNDTLDSLKQAFDIAGEGSINALEFPAISIPGTSFSTPAVSVPLRPMSDSIYDYIAKFIDIIATIAVFNMLLTKFKAFLVGEKVVEIEDVD